MFNNYYNNNNDKNNKIFNDIIFFQIWRNNILKFKILKYIRLNNDWRKINFNLITKQQQQFLSDEQLLQHRQNYPTIESIMEFLKKEESRVYKSIMVNYIYNKEQFLKFIKLYNGYEGGSENDYDFSTMTINREIAVGYHMNRLWFYKGNSALHINDLVIPQTITDLNLQGVEIKTFTLSPSAIFSKLFKSSNSNSDNETNKITRVDTLTSPFFGVETLRLGELNDSILSNNYLSKAINLKRLIVDSNQIKSPIKAQMLPNNGVFEFLSIQSNYPFADIYIPSTLKTLEFKGTSRNQMLINQLVFDDIPSTVQSLRFIYCLTYQDIFLQRDLLNSLIKFKVKVHTIKERGFLNFLLIHLNCNINTLPTSAKTTTKMKKFKVSCQAGPLQCLNVDLLPPTLESLELPYSLLTSTISNKRGYPSNINSFKGTLSHLSSNFENPLNVLKISIIITSVYTKNNNNKLNPFGEQFEEYNPIVYINNQQYNDQLLNQFQNLNSLILNYEEPNLFSNNFQIPISITNLEINNYISNKLINQNNNSSNNTSSTFNDKITFNLDLLKLVNLKSLKFDPFYTILFFDYLIQKQDPQNKSTTTNPFPSSLILLDLNLNLSFGRDLNWFFINKNNYLNQIKILILRGKFNPEIKSLPSSLDFVFIQDINPILNNKEFVNKYSELIREFNVLDEDLLYKRLKNQINNGF